MHPQKNLPPLTKIPTSMIWNCFINIYTVKMWTPPQCWALIEIFTKGWWGQVQKERRIPTGQHLDPSICLWLYGLPAAFLLCFSHYENPFNHVGAFLLLFFYMVGLFLDLPPIPAIISAGAHVTCGGLFGYFLLHGVFWGGLFPPPLRKFLRAPMRASLIFNY